MLIPVYIKDGVVVNNKPPKVLMQRQEKQKQLLDNSSTEGSVEAGNADVDVQDSQANHQSFSSPSS